MERTTATFGGRLHLTIQEKQKVQIRFALPGHKLWIGSTMEIVFLTLRRGTDTIDN